MYIIISILYIILFKLEVKVHALLYMVGELSKLSSKFDFELKLNNKPTWLGC